MTWTGLLTTVGFVKIIVRRRCSFLQAQIWKNSFCLLVFKDFPRKKIVCRFQICAIMKRLNSTSIPWVWFCAIWNVTITSSMRRVCFAPFWTFVSWFDKLQGKINLLFSIYFVDQGLIKHWLLLEVLQRLISKQDSFDYRSFSDAC